MCLPLPKEVDRGAAAIQRDDQIVLIAGCGRMRKDFAASQLRQDSTGEASWHAFRSPARGR